MQIYKTQIIHSFSDLSNYFRFERSLLNWDSAIHNLGFTPGLF